MQADTELVASRAMTKQSAIRSQSNSLCSDSFLKQTTGIQITRRYLGPLPSGLHAATSVQYLAGGTVLLATVGLGSLAITGWVVTEHEAGIGSL